MQTFNLFKPFSLFLFLALLSSLFFDAQTVFGFVSIPRAVSVLFVVYCLLWLGKDDYKFAFKSFYLFILLLVYLMARTAVTDFPFDENYFYSLSINLFTAVIIVGFLNKLKRLDKVLGLSFYLVSFFSMLAFWHVGIQVSGDHRASFLGLNANEYAALLLFGLVSGLYFLDKSPLRFAKFSGGYYLGFVVILIAMIETGTRYAMIIGILSILFYGAVVYYRHSQKWLALYYWTIPLVSIFIVYLNYPPNIEQTVFARFDPNKLSENNLLSIGGRTDLWLLSLKAFINSPIVGLGYEDYVYFLRESTGFVYRPHNIVFELLAVGGAVTLVFVLMIVRQWRDWLVESHSDLALTILFIFPMVVISMMQNISSFKLFWLYLAVSVYLMQQKERQD